MKVFVVGGTGRVATEVIKKLIEQDDEVIVGSRRPEAVSIRGETINTVSMDLHDSSLELSKLLGNVDAIIFAAGSRGKDLFQTDLFGAVKLMQAAKIAGVKRFIMLSALQSLNPENWDEKVAHLKDYLVAKYFADNYLVNQSELDYTIIQPGALLESKGTSQISLGDQGFTSIPIPDVAESLAKAVHLPETVGKVYAINPGNDSIETALRGG